MNYQMDPGLNYQGQTSKRPPTQQQQYLEGETPFNTYNGSKDFGIFGEFQKNDVFSSDKFLEEFQQLQQQQQMLPLIQGSHRLSESMNMVPQQYAMGGGQELYHSNSARSLGLQQLKTPQNQQQQIMYTQGYGNNNNRSFDQQQQYKNAKAGSQKSLIITDNDLELNKTRFSQYLEAGEIEKALGIVIFITNYNRL